MMPTLDIEKILASESPKFYQLNTVSSKMSGIIALVLDYNGWTIDDFSDFVQSEFINKILED